MVSAASADRVGKQSVVVVVASSVAIAFAAEHLGANGERGPGAANFGGSAHIRIASFVGRAPRSPEGGQADELVMMCSDLVTRPARHG